ncbi:mechanosensitive ion channel family protein [Mangrovimonas spongiae]|uniref:Mechanosensitive ion channel n=1 Tax=Mangrovimonas spongiae TaxID=2494697 RepID=A0A428K1H7_9FLAO|nr:mechanosensitive ion channel [Mangrovimonas spongiae]RSK40238.1 mechanosensitive ion channel [Mangrovimonas spongiae]
MNKINEWKEMLLNSLSAIWNDIIAVVPKILGALVVLLIGWILTKIVVKIIKKALGIIKADKLDDKLNDIRFFGDKKFNFNIINIVSAFAKWGLFLIFLILATQIMEWTIISEEISNLLRYLPQLISAIALFLIGLYIAGFVKNTLQKFFKEVGFSGGKIISSIVFLILFTFITITALNQAGIDTGIITNNITMILAGFLLALALAIGLGARDVVDSLLKAYYTRRLFVLGQVVSFNGVTGEIVAVNDITITLKTEQGKLIVPIKEIVDNQVEIKS